MAARSGGPYASPRSFSARFIVIPISAGESLTYAPAARRAAEGDGSIEVGHGRASVGLAPRIVDKWARLKQRAAEWRPFSLSVRKRPYGNES
jgi:hypothetical protein